jgi:hypothetical protein
MLDENIKNSDARLELLEHRRKEAWLECKIFNILFLGGFAFIILAVGAEFGMYSNGRSPILTYSEISILIVFGLVLVAISIMSIQKYVVVANYNILIFMKKNYQTNIDKEQENK